MVTIRNDKHLRYFSEKTKLTAAEIAEHFELNDDDAGRYFSELLPIEALDSLMGRPSTSYERQIFPKLFVLGTDDCPICGMLLEVVEWEGYEVSVDYDTIPERITTYQRLKCRHCGAETEEGEQHNGF